MLNDTSAYRESFLRIVVNDYSGHPFQIELSRSLARRGHAVLHIHFADFQTPKGDLLRRSDDPSSFEVHGVTIGRPFAKNSYVRRVVQERRYGRLVAQLVSAFKPDVVIGCNNPLDAQHALLVACQRMRVPFVFWLQDIYSVAISHILRKKLSVLGVAIGKYYRRLERNLLQKSDAVVAITDDFLPIIAKWGIAKERCTVIQNWSPLSAISLQNKSNTWSRQRGLADTNVVLYSGTLGLKHDPMLLVELAEQLRSRADTVVLVISEGPGADLVSREAAKRNLKNLQVLPFQPFAEYSQVLGCADILLALIEPEAGIFSVPSKVLSYLCAARALVLSIPPENLAAKIVTGSGAGVCVNPRERDAFFAAVTGYLDDAPRRSADGQRGREYAEKEFGIDRITGQFEAVFQKVVA
jgi:glycosyltransferase involved in cell wall biosynthesis